MRTLVDVGLGDGSVVVKVHGVGALRRRIMDMGFTRGAEVSVRKVAPFGDPLQVSVRGTEVSLRRSDAATIEVA